MTKNPDVLARNLVGLHLAQQQPAIHAIIDDHTKEFHALVDAIRQAAPVDSRYLSSDERCTMIEELQAAVPEWAIRLRDISDSTDTDESYRIEAAFLIGLELGLARRGAR